MVLLLELQQNGRTGRTGVEVSGFTVVWWLGGVDPDGLKNARFLPLLSEFCNNLQTGDVVVSESDFVFVHKNIRNDVAVVLMVC